MMDLVTIMGLLPTYDLIAIGGGPSTYDIATITYALAAFGSSTFELATIMGPVPMLLQILVVGTLLTYLPMLLQL